MINLTELQNVMNANTEEFIPLAYQLILNRDVDAEGLRYYSERLRIGYSKKKILLQLTRSNEFKNIPANEEIALLVRNYPEPIHFRQVIKNILQKFKIIKKNNEHEIYRLDNSKEKPISEQCNEIWIRLLKYGMNKRNLWIGRVCPIDATIFDFGNYTNYRARSEMHQNFDVVWLYERSLFDFTSWQILIDEAIRFINEDGIIITRTSDSVDGTLWELKSILNRIPTVDVDLYTQEKLIDGSTICVFHIKRKYLEKYRSRSWTIGILSNGTKQDNIKLLIDSINEIKENINVEILIAGPVFDIEVFENVKFIDVPEDDLARIGDKKMRIIQNAKFDNIAIFHDRYVVNNDFFIGFNEYGYDFDYLTIMQYYESGKIFPGYVGLPEKKMRWQIPMHDKTYMRFFQGHFINGGLIIIKKHLQESVKFNKLLLHNEAEDVELSFTLMSFGIHPRINIYSSARTVSVQDNYTNSFIEVG